MFSRSEVSERREEGIKHGVACSLRSPELMKAERVRFGLKATRKPLGIEHAFAKCGRPASPPAAEVRTAFAKSSAFITMDSFWCAECERLLFSQIFYQIQFHCVYSRAPAAEENKCDVCLLQERLADNL